MRRRLGIAAVALALLGSVVALRAAAPAAAFGPADVTPPTLVVGGEVTSPHTPLNDIVVVFDDVLLPGSIPAGADLADFDVEVDSGVPPRTRDLVTSAQLTHVGLGSPDQINTFVTLTLEQPISGGTVTVAYNPGGHPIRDEAGNAAQASGEIKVLILAVSGFGAFAGVVDGLYGANHLELMLPDSIATPLPAATAFRVGRNADAPVAPVGVSIFPKFGGRILDLTLPFSFDLGDEASISYTKPVLNPLRNTFGDEAPGFGLGDIGVFVALVASSSAAGSVTPGSPLTTDAGAPGPTALDPLATTVAVPDGAPAGITGSIAESTTTPPQTADFSFLGQSIVIDLAVAGGPYTTSQSSPIVLEFSLDASVLNPAGVTEQTLDIFRNGVLVGECPGATTLASPNPCVASRTRFPTTGPLQYATFRILTTEASTWTFGAPRFRSPVDAPPIVNTVTAGRGVPVKFGLGGNLGLNIFATGYPKSQVVACDTKAPTDAVETTMTAGASSLSYDAATQTYSYVWKTDKAWSYTCRQLILKFIDGSTRVAIFRFS